MRTLSFFLISIFLSVPGYSRQGTVLTPVQARYVAPLANMLRTPKTETLPGSLMPLVELSRIDYGEGDGEARLRLENKPEEALALIETLERAQIHPEQLETEAFVGDSRSYGSELIEMVEQASRDVNERYERLDEESNRLRGGLLALGSVRSKIEDFKKRAARMSADHFFLYPYNAGALGAILGRIERAEEDFEADFRTFNKELRGRIETETLGAVHDHWVYKQEGRETWHTLNLGPAVAFATPESALWDQLDRLEAAPQGPWLVPILDSVQRTLEDSDVVSEESVIGIMRGRLQQIRITQQRAHDERERKRTAAKLEGGLHLKVKKRASLSYLESLLEEAIEITGSVGADGRPVDAGINMRIDRAFERVGIFNFSLIQGWVAKASETWGWRGWKKIQRNFSLGLGIPFTVVFTAVFLTENPLNWRALGLTVFGFLLFAYFVVYSSYGIRTEEKIASLYKIVARQIGAFRKPVSK